MWLEAEQGVRWLEEGADAWIYPRPPTPARTRAELDAAVLVLLERYLQELHEEGDLRGVAFELSELIPLAPAAGIAQLEALVEARAQLGREWASARWAMASALVNAAQAGHLQLGALRERWAAQPAFDELLTELDDRLAELAQYDDDDDDPDTWSEAR